MPAKVEKQIMSFAPLQLQIERLLDVQRVDPCEWIGNFLQAAEKFLTLYVQVRVSHSGWPTYLKVNQ